MQRTLLRWTLLLAIALALFVVMLGAYTRLTDAGLGCPDWPGCYGQMAPPSTVDKIHSAQSQYPDLPLENRKAWTEMAHRYAAGTLALLIVFIGWFTIGNKQQRSLAIALVLLVVFQAILGMWTVTLKLLPVVVMGHLIGGMLIFSFLCRLFTQIAISTEQDHRGWRLWLSVGFFIVLLQIALGGWVSSNYAGLACIGFPTCNGVWFPKLFFMKGFNLFSSFGVNYQGGILENEVRVTIQYIHRLGAIITASYILILSSLILTKARGRKIRTGALLMVFLVLLQFILGVLNVTYLLPLPIAVAHNGVAALLLALLFSLLQFTYRSQPHGH
ncbi:MAG: COX15/CtaA family protein [Legionella sp.]|nr:COX15/CtaA family protein [Legionella sp.]